MLSMVRYDAAAGHVVLVECHHYSFSAAFNAVVVVHWSCEFLGGQNNHFLYVQVPGIGIVMDYYYRLLCVASRFQF